MAKTVCALCQKKLGGLWLGPGHPMRETEISNIPAYYDVFPDAPYRQFSDGSAHICGDCTEKIVNLFGCKLNHASLPTEVLADALQDAQMQKAAQYVKERIDNFPAGRDKDFLVYALSMPSKIIDFRQKQLWIRLHQIETELVTVVAENAKKRKQVIQAIKSQNRAKEEHQHTFGIVDGELLHVGDSVAYIETCIEMLRKQITLITQQMVLDRSFESDIKELFIENCSKEPVVEHYPLSKIKHFKMVGSIGYSSDVHGGGGGGGGANLGGAIYGGLLFGTAGAIVGSQMGTEIHIDEIKTDVTRHDDRNVEFFYENETGKTVSVIFDSSAYDCLMALIPEKAFDSVVTNAQPKEEPVAVASSNSSLSQLKELKELLDMGIITQAEFDAKKKQLLGL